MLNLRLLTPSPSTVGEDVFPVSEFAEHVRVGDADVTEETPELQRALRTAISMLERRLSLLLLPGQQWVWTPKSWTAASIPLRPVQSIQDIFIVTAQGVETRWDSQYWQLDGNSILPFGSFPPVPFKGHAKVTFTAGFDHIPANLHQAVLLLAAYLYEHRTAQALHQMPYQVESLITPFKNIRLGARAKCH